MAIYIFYKVRWFMFILKIKNIFISPLTFSKVISWKTFQGHAHDVITKSQLAKKNSSKCKKNI